MLLFLWCVGERVDKQSGYPPSKHWTGVQQSKTRVEPGALPRVGRPRPDDPGFPLQTCFYIFRDTGNAESCYWLAGIPLSPHEARSTSTTPAIPDDKEHVYRRYRRYTRPPLSHGTHVGHGGRASKTTRWKPELEDREREPGGKAT